MILMLDIERMAVEHQALFLACREAAEARRKMLSEAGIAISWYDAIFDVDDTPWVTFNMPDTIEWTGLDSDGDRIYMIVPVDVLTGAQTVSEWVGPEIEQHRQRTARQRQQQEVSTAALLEHEHREYMRLKAKFEP